MTSMQGYIARLREWWPHDDSPGYSDQPECDIRTHRSNARLYRWAGVAALLVCFVAAFQAADPIYLAYGLAAFAFAGVGELILRVQALEWELQLEREGDR